MNIKNKSMELLKLLYKEISENAYCLVINVPVQEFITKHKITNEHFNLCLCYLKSKNLIGGDITHVSEVAPHIKRDIILSADAIDLIESKV